MCVVKGEARGWSSQICKNLIQSSCFEKAACNITVGVYGKSNHETSDLPVNTKKLYSMTTEYCSVQFKTQREEKKGVDR